MSIQITEDGARFFATTRRPSAGLKWLFATAMVLATAASAAGQPAFSAKVVSLGQNVQRITVPLHGSVTVETTVEIARADVIATQVADVQVISPRRILITGQGYGLTSIVLAAAGDQQHVLEVSVELDLSRLNEAIEQIDPLSDARASSVMGNIILSGFVSSVERAARIVDLATLFLPPAASSGQQTSVQNHMEVAGEQQVLLRVVIAEVKRDASRELGVNGFLAGDDFQDAFLVNQLGGINPINIGAAGDALATGRIPFLTDEDGIPISAATTLSLGFPRVQMQLFIQAMADNGLLKVLAEPNLVTISGEEATFLAGGEFPIEVAQGDERTTIEFKEFGVQLNFTPVVHGGERIRLRVNPVISELDFSIAIRDTPGLITRSAETTVELGNGETIAIAGLFSDRMNATASRIPGLGDLPVLGALFRSVSYQRNQTEMVILVTAELIAPLDAHQDIPLPGGDVSDPTDFELYFLGKVEGGESGSAGNAVADNGAGHDPTLPSEPNELSVHGPWGHADRPNMR